MKLLNAKVRVNPIQGMLLGLEWDWENEWFSLNFFIIKVVVDYNHKMFSIWDYYE